MNAISSDRRTTRAERTNGAVSPILSPGRKRGRPKAEDQVDYFTPFYKESKLRKYNVVTQIFQYLSMRELSNCSKVSRLWRQLVTTPMLWKNVRMKNAQVSDWTAFCAMLKKFGTRRLDLRKMLLPPNDTEFWDQFSKHIGTVKTLERLELCRCPARAVEAACRALPGLTVLSALAIRDSKLSPTALSATPKLHELRLKSLAGLTLASSLSPLQQLIKLRHLSLTSIKELGARAQGVIGQLHHLLSLELGECTFGAEFGSQLAQLKQLQRLRLERGTAECAATDILRSIATLPELTQLELVNFDVKTGFDLALAECHNIQRLLIIPTYVSQSATTNKLVLSGVLLLKDTLTHLMWGVTIELLRVTELFIDQCDHVSGLRASSGRIVEKKKVDIGECIPVLKPLPGCNKKEVQVFQGPPQVEVVPLASLQRLLSLHLPNTKHKLLRIPFHATWRQSLADFQ